MGPAVGSFAGDGTSLGDSARGGTYIDENARGGTYLDDSARGGTYLDEGKTTVVIEWHQIEGKPSEPLTHPLLQVYSDGRVLIHDSTENEEIADYRLTLPPQRVEALLRSAVESGLLEFRDADIARAMARARQARHESQTNPTPAEEVTAEGKAKRADAKVIVLTLRLADPSSGKPMERTLAWPGLELDRAAYPDVAPLQALANFVDQLRALTTSDDRQPVP